MASRDLVNNIAKVLLTSPGNAAASPLTSLKSNILDTQGFESVMLTVATGTFVNVTASNYLTFTLQESDSTADSSFTNVSITANLLGGVASATADFGDQERPFGNSLTSLLPAPAASIPTLFTGLLPLNDPSQANSHFSVGYIGSKRYIRLLGTFTGAPTTLNMDVVGYLSHAQYEPIISPAPVTAT